MIACAENATEHPPGIGEIRAELRARHPDIRPYGEDDWDWTWADEGMEYLASGDIGMAELKFQELIVAQPEHPDGYEGLALVREAAGRIVEAAVLIDEAARLAEQLLERGHIEAFVREEIGETRHRIRAALAHSAAGNA